jgi:hypothetical protein
MQARVQPQFHSVASREGVQTLGPFDPTHKQQRSWGKEDHITDHFEPFHALNSPLATSAIPGISAAAAIRILSSSIMLSANRTLSCPRSRSSSITAVKLGAASVFAAITVAIFGYLAASITAESTLAFNDTA